MGKKVLIVGGVAGGASAAARLRRLDETLEIIMFEKGEYISFANCGLPYHIGEIIKERDKLLVQTPKAMRDRFNIDVRVFSEVIDIDSDNKKIKINSKDKGLYEESYDYLVLSPGAKPIRPNIEGIDSEKIYTLRNVRDMDKIKSLVDEGQVKKAIVIGGGYVGVEVAENLVERNVKTTLVEAAPHILAPFDSEMVTLGEKELQENGVSLRLNDGVKAFNELGNGVEVKLNSGKRLVADMVVLAIGVTPDTSFLKSSGIDLGPKGHILVNDKMETNKEGIYAVGDAIEIHDYINGNKAAIPLAGPANRQGRLAADNIYGLNRSYKGTLGTAIIKIFNLTGASTGNNERTLRRLDIPYKVIYVHPSSHASYYPGATQMSIKLLFNEEGTILGAQGFGYDGVDKTIDVIAATIKSGGTIYDLSDLELAYAPPFNSAKSPANMAGFVAENVLSGLMDVINIYDLENYDENKNFLLDVREEIEWNNGYIKGATLIPVNSLRDRLKEVPRDKEIWVYCAVGLRGYIATRILMQNGFKVKNFTGGYKTYSQSLFTPKDGGDNDDDSSGGQKVEKERALDVNNTIINKEVDACGLCCPGPLMTVKNNMDELKGGEVLKVRASDPGFFEDIKAWARKTGNKLLNLEKENGIITATVEKIEECSVLKNINSDNSKDNKTMVVFSGDLDKAIASFIIANGATSMGKKVTMFFTFWGINILRKPDGDERNKGFINKAFGFMMPKGSKKLKLSQMNMGGMGPKLIRKIMKDKNVASLEELIKSAIDSGVEIVACQMSMDLLGFSSEELIEGVKIGGVGYYLGEAEDSNVNLFI
ncbi:DsrE/DsrF/DrsH-like family protein [Clostridium hydrogeniformans]|uniref:DsrE/DsrF/DrsH-like family protein n=1 Tax=Clostridium hydrogeniformans TaxID=349933 RepID=UPI0004880310|nr:DsrE/DsrF/DrsH-like family protein [Clostridium hydrogeniformans]